MNILIGMTVTALTSSNGNAPAAAPVAGEGPGWVRVNTSVLFPQGTPVYVGKGWERALTLAWLWVRGDVVAS